MKKSTKYILLGLLGLLAIFGIIVWVRFRQLKDELENGTDNKNGTNNSMGGAYGGSVTTPSGTVSVTTPTYYGTDSTKWKVGATLKALTDVNIYSSASIGESTLVKTIPAGYTIGTYQGSATASIKKIKYLDMAYYMYPTIKDGFIFVSGNVVNS